MTNVNTVTAAPTNVGLYSLVNADLGKGGKMEEIAGKLANEVKDLQNELVTEYNKGDKRDEGKIKKLEMQMKSSMLSMEAFQSITKAIFEMLQRAAQNLGLR